VIVVANKYVTLTDGTDSIIPKNGFNVSLAGNGGSITYEYNRNTTYYVFSKRNNASINEWCLYIVIYAQAAGGLVACEMKNAESAKLNFTFDNNAHTMTISNPNNVYVFCNILPS
jgi:hypothetical protein